MAEELLINWAPQETRVALIDGGAVQEIHLERPAERGIVGNIYLGKVARVLPGMQSAFIDIGLERAAFLHVADVWQSPGADKDKEAPAKPAADAAHPAAPVPPIPIEKLVFEGQALVVQVIKDPIGTKGARLSTQISIAGRQLVFLPQDEHIGISQKIGDAEARERLRQRVTVLAQAAAAAEPQQPAKVGGYILRTNGEDATDEELASDVAYLRKAWAAVRNAATRLPPGSLLHQDLNLLQRVLRDMVSERTASIQIDSKEQFALLQAFGQQYMPQATQKLQLYKGERPIFDLHGIEQEIEGALARRVNLKSGGYLIIDQTEALTTIDVNTGGFVGARNFDDTIFKNNLEAALAIARQLRLRNLGGIVIVDFIDMQRSEHREAVLAEFRKQLAKDRTKTTVSGFSNLGLVEMTRKRTRESLAHMLCEPCPTCQSRGEVKTPRSVCYDILREILREARQFNPKEFRVIASANVVERFLDEESQHLAGLSEFIGKPVSLQSDPQMSQEQYDIVLM